MRYWRCLLLMMMMVWAVSWTSARSEAVYYPDSQVMIMPGDVLITNNAKPVELIGHAAIVIDREYVVEIRGHGLHPQWTKITDFFHYHISERTGVEVIRYQDDVIARQAADWANRYALHYPDVSYEIDELYSYHTHTYCSKLIFSAYFYGAGVRLPTSAIKMGPGAMIMFLPWDIKRSPQTTSILRQGNIPLYIP